MERRLNFAGCSGIGKTTLAKALSEQWNVPFVSGSYSDLVPSTKDMSHNSMIMEDAQTIYAQDTKLMALRRKLFRNTSEFICDRSFLDSAAYMIQKLSHRLPQCDIEDFVEKCRILTVSLCPKTVFLPFTEEYFYHWEIEQNGKRISNKFYQTEVSLLMGWLLSHWGCELHDVITIGNDQAPVWSMEAFLPGGEKEYTQILVLETQDHEKRMRLINEFLQW